MAELNEIVNELIEETIGFADGDQQTNKNPKIELLTDEAIAQYSGDNVLNEYRDIDLHIKTRIAPYPKGVYDQDIFGSLFSDRCNCGTVRTVGLRCPRCGSMILDENQSFKRFARIESPVYYCTKYKFKKLLEFITGTFNVQMDIQSAQFDTFSRTDRAMAIYDICQWSYNEEEEILTISDNITDFSMCSYEGLVKIINEYFPDKLQQLRAYINQYILVVPLVMRAPQIRFINNSREIDNHRITVAYKDLIYAIYVYYDQVFPTMKTESGRAIFRGSLRKMISSTLDSMTQLFNPSQSNLARTMQGNRLPNSGRCVVVPDPTLEATEVMIPRHLMYETCRDEFIKFLSDKKQISMKEAELIYKSQSNLDEVQSLFDEFINGDGTEGSGKYVIINRAPSLHDLSMYACKVRLTNDYTMKIPLVLCEPTNGDFDGDQFSFYAVPNRMNELVINSLSAKNRYYYRKNHKPIYLPKGDMMHGLTLATKLDPQKSPKSFDSLDDLKEYKRNTPGFKYQTEVILNGNHTTLGREILSEMFDKDINIYLGSNLNHSRKDCLDAKNMIYLYYQLGEKEDRLKRIEDIQKFVLTITTVSGSSAVKISDLYIGIDKKYLDRIKKLEDDDTIDPKTKEIAVRDIYDEFEAEELKKIPEGVRMAIDESGRAKSTELRDMTIQQLKVSPYRDFHVTETTLAEGMSPTDYIWHAIENRSTQTISKRLAVPQSGYLTRQFIYTASEYHYEDKTDEKNDGIDIEEKYCEGRTTVDGKLCKNVDSKSEKILKIRSIITSHAGKYIITKDMIPDLIKYTKGSRIGMSLVSSITEQLTQGGLKLKHGGALWNLNYVEDDKSEDHHNDYGVYRAPEDGTLEISKPWVLFHGKSKTYRYPLTEKFTPKYSPDNKYKAGNVFAINYQSVTPSYTLDSVIKLCGARSTSDTHRYANNKKEYSLCYAAKDGVLHYNYVDGWMQVTIDNDDYWFDETCAYTLPDGSEVHKGERICTGTLNLSAMSEYESDYIELYYHFRRQFKELMGDSLSDELIEFMYVLLTKNEENGALVQSVWKSIYGSDAFFKTLAFGDSRQSFNKIGYEGLDFIADPITSIMLSMIVGDETNN